MKTMMSLKIRDRPTKGATLAPGRRRSPERKTSRAAHIPLETMTDGEVRTLSPEKKKKRTMRMTTRMSVAVSRTTIAGATTRSPPKGSQMRSSSGKPLRLRPKPPTHPPPNPVTNSGEGHRAEAMNLIVAQRMTTTSQEAPRLPLTTHKRTLTPRIEIVPTKILWQRLPRRQSRPKRTRHSRRSPRPP